LSANPIIIQVSAAYPNEHHRFFANRVVGQLRSKKNHSQEDHNKGEPTATMRMLPFSQFKAVLTPTLLHLSENTHS
jgi:hypothetical protein